MSHLLKKQSLGKQYGFIFTLVILLFTVSVMVTYLLLDDTNQSIDETEETNAIVVEVNKWMSLYQEKYVFIPEYIIEESEQRLLDYLSLSSEFVDQAKRVRPLLSTEEQVQAFNQILNNNHQLDQYYFSDVVPNVQQINTAVFTTLQSELSTLKSDTLSAGNTLIDASVSSNQASIKQANDNITRTISMLVLSIIISLLISVVLILIMNRRIKKQLTNVVQTADAISHGDLTTTDVHANASKELSLLSDAINQMKQNLHHILRDVGHLSEEINDESKRFVTIAHDVESGSEQVALTIEELAHGASSQADEASSISEKTKAFNDQIETALNHSHELVDTSDQTLSTADDGYKHMQVTERTMTDITRTVEQSVQQVTALEKDTTNIGKFIGMITDIADQTNLLALNASIEAARAGEAGKGFQVVAEEVRKLAENVHDASQSITDIVTHIQSSTEAMVNDLNEAFTKVTEGQAQMKQSSAQFNHIKDNIQLMATRIDGISSIIDDFKVASANINDSVENIAAISEESAAGAEEISASAIEQKRAMEQVSSGATTLQSSIEAIDALMAQFNLEEDSK